jgi:hypothetical protein
MRQLFQPIFATTASTKGMLVMKNDENNTPWWKATVILIGFVSTLILFSTSPAGAAWLPAPYQPDGLNLGDKYHLVFVMSSKNSIDGTSSSQAVYDARVQADADAFGIGSTAGVLWFAMVSTPDSEARQQPPAPYAAGGFNGNGIGPNTPVYNMSLEELADDRLVATGFADLWNGSIGHTIGFEADGNNNIGQAVVWTGSDSNGNNAANGSHMGTAFPRTGYVLTTSAGWISDDNSLPNTELRRLYAISEELTVVPEPSSLVLAALSVIGFALVAVLRRGRPRR